MALTTVDDVANMLRWSDEEKTKYQGQIPAYIAAATLAVEGEVGPVEPRTVAHTADGGPSVALPYWATLVSSVTVDGAAVSGWVADLDAGIVYGPFAPGRQNVVVTFTTGYTVVPEDAKLATTMVVCDMWAIASQRAPSFDDRTDPSYLMPQVVRRLLEPLKAKKMPGFA